MTQKTTKIIDLRPFQTNIYWIKVNLINFTIKKNNKTPYNLLNSKKESNIHILIIVRKIDIKITNFNKIIIIHFNVHLNLK